MNMAMRVVILSLETPQVFYSNLIDSRLCLLKGKLGQIITALQIISERSEVTPSVLWLGTDYSL